MIRTTKSMVFTGMVLALMHVNVSARGQGQVRGATVQTTQPNIDKRRLSPDDVRKVAPALEAYTGASVWRHMEASWLGAARSEPCHHRGADRSRSSPALTYYFDQALENGVKPREISEIITHWRSTRAGRTRSARSDRRECVRTTRHWRRINSPPCPCSGCRSTNRRRPHGPSWSASNSARPHQGVVQYTTDVLFRDLWLRPDLAAIRSLVTVSALIATGQAAQLSCHLNRAMDHGLTQPEAAEALTHLAFYTGGRASSQRCPSRKTYSTAPR